MEIKILLITTVLFFMSCNNQKQSHEEDLMNAIIEVIDSNAFPEKIIAVIKSEFDYEDYHLYRIRGFRDYMTPDPYPYKIKEIKNKIVFFYFSEEEELAEEPVDKIIEEHYDYDYYNINSSTAFFFVQCKTTGKKLLHHAVNEYMQPYEIPEIRDFSCSSGLIKKQSIEVITDFFNIYALDYQGLGSDTISKHPKSIDLVVYVYNRTDSCLFFDGLNTSFGKFMLIKGNDTLQFNPSLYGGSRIIDDSTFVEDPEKSLELRIESDENLSFFNKINPNHFHEDLISLIRDSLYYIPNQEFYESSNHQCISPKGKIKVFTAPITAYRYTTPNYVYAYGNGKFLWKDKR
ncbi:hypothetical protein [Bacteroides sp. 519]|uniref:hypothetical protein n=1 Tax=Bacteroides sp. 519 TaxID=2302937 RepID=UPI0013D09AF4|nr:hypothetical protein [Bacteroides sp. 519]NDV60160.1 hypothetical protein [Bacteroides sp. 519]